MSAPQRSRVSSRLKSRRRDLRSLRDRGPGRNVLRADASEERDWVEDMPELRLGRAFAVVLALHILAIVGVMSYERLKDDPIDAADAVAGAKPHSNATAAVERAAHGRNIASDGKTYIVRPGDDLMAISIDLGVAYTELLALNNLTVGSPIYPGQDLLIPSEKLSQNTLPAPAPESDGEGYLRVTAIPAEPIPSEPDEVADVAAAEDRSDGPGVGSVAPPSVAPTEGTPLPHAPPVVDPVPVVEEEVVPEAPRAIRLAIHEVLSGETVDSIATAYGVDPVVLARMNRLGSRLTSLAPGSILRVPVAD